MSGRHIRVYYIYYIIYNTAVSMYVVSMYVYDGYYSIGLSIFREHGGYYTNSNNFSPTGETGI